jgi:hypothetical protein
MNRVWLVWCGHCGRGATIAEPPKSVGFVKDVQCVLCNKIIDANKGAFNYYKEKIEPAREPDLLSVE